MVSSDARVKLPSPVFDIYRQYKTSTATVITWLNKFGGFAPPQSQLTISQLQHAAERARSRNIDVPNVVHLAFQESVAKRREVTRWFMSAELGAERKPSQSTLNHIHFSDK